MDIKTILVNRFNLVNLLSKMYIKPIMGTAQNIGLCSKAFVISKSSKLR